MKMNFTLPIVALVGGAALGYCLAPSAATPAEKPAETPIAPARIADAGDAEAVKALRARIRDLEKELASARAGATEEKVQEERRDRGDRGGRRNGPDWGDMRARLDQWKKDNPEEFAKMEKARQDFMQRRAQQAQSKIDFLASVDTSRMNKQAKATHEALQGLIARREEIQQKLFSPDTADEERGRLFQEMRETEHQINEKNGQERSNLLQQTAEALGFSGAEATEIVDTIGEIYEATSNQRGGFGPGGPMGGFGGGRGGRGGRR